MNNGMAPFPDRDVVLYDDRDEACRYQIARIREWDTAGRLTFVRLTDPRAIFRFSGAGECLRPGMIAFIGVDGTQAFGADALEWILHRLPSGKSRMLAALGGEEKQRRTKRPYSGMTNLGRRSARSESRSSGDTRFSGGSHLQSNISNRRMDH